MKTSLSSFAVFGLVVIAAARVMAGDCDCQHAGQSNQTMSMVHMNSCAGDACGCSSAALPGCCGAGGLAGIGAMYSSQIAYGGSFSNLFGHGSASPGSFVSGFENLPNMDGGGVHYRYPYHSYRRPWAFPGTPSTNVTIVW